MKKRVMALLATVAVMTAVQAVSVATAFTASHLCARRNGGGCDRRSEQRQALLFQERVRVR